MVAGIIDPTKVIRCALENACSVAKTFLTSDVVVCEIPEKEPAMQGNAMDNSGYGLGAVCAGVVASEPPLSHGEGRLGRCGLGRGALLYICGLGAGLLAKAALVESLARAKSRARLRSHRDVNKLFGSLYRRRAFPSREGGA
eukprot:3284986-Pyramimonas_sp.AAC.2